MLNAYRSLLIKHHLEMYFMKCIVKIATKLYVLMHTFLNASAKVI